jgi:hypothetical protein
MAAKDDTVNVPVMPTATVALGPGLAGLDDPAKAVAGSLLLPDAGAILAGRATNEQMRRLSIREDLLKAARENFDDIIGTAETRYSRDLAALTVSLNAYLKDDPGENAGAIYLDPAKFDAAMALGFEETAAIGRVLKRQGLNLDPEVFDDQVSLLVNAGNTMEKYESRFGINIYSHGAVSMRDIGVATPTNVILPATDHAMTTPVPGFTPKENEDFINRHEGWHAKDKKYTLKGMPGLPDDVQDQIASFKIESIANSAEVRAAYVSRHRDEILADVGALGDMIRAGKDPKVIDTVSAWRKSDPDDDRHMSVQGLDGLKLEMRKMGLGNFRKLNDRAAKQFYYDVVEQYGIDEAALKAAAEYELAEYDDEKRAAMVGEAKVNPAVAKGLAFAGLVGAAAVRAADEGNPLKPGEDVIKDALQKWDAMQALQDRAFRDSGRITPATMVKAYATVSDDLKAAMEGDPDNHLIDLKMSKLKTTFLETVPKMDYVEANKRFGVDIVELEPALEKYKPATKSATRLAVPPKPGG